MRLKTGKFAGKTTEEIYLKEPGWMAYVVNMDRETPIAKAFLTLARKFRNKPFTVPCDGNCGTVATRASAYAGSPDLMFWCESCNHTRSGAEGRKLTVVRSVSDVLQHIEFTARGHRGYSKAIVRQLAEGKGLPKRVGEKQAMEFFQ